MNVIGYLFWVLLFYLVSKVMLIGSGEEDKATEKTTTIYNNALNTFTDGPTMNYMRRYAACARFKSKLHDNRYVVMSVGGHQISNVELLDYTMPNAQWTESKYLPKNYNLHLSCTS